MLEGLSFALGAAATLVRDGEYLPAITAAMATARLLEVTGPVLCADAMGKGLTLEEIDAAMENGVVLTTAEGEYVGAIDIRPEDFA